ncbi:MAG: FG-GAP repeat protein [Marinoscillum sp.]
MRKLILGFFIVGIFGSGYSQTYFNQQKLKAEASEREAEDYFGFVVGISGDYAIVGAGYEDEDADDNNTKAESGSVYIFERSSDGWSRVQKLVASDRSSDDYFGYGAAISGEYAIVGASYHEFDENGANGKEGAGTAYFYERGTDGTWDEAQKIVASDRALYSEFGVSVGISGDYAIVGAYGDDNYTGAAYIFERDEEGNWSEVEKLLASDGAEDDEFGLFVAISGDYAIVGSYGDDSYTGAAYIFERDVNGDWNEVEKLAASDAASNDTFGAAVAIDGDYAIVGAYAEDEDDSGSETKEDAGSAYIFERDVDGNWNEVQKIVASDRDNQDQFGSSVAVSGDYAIVGAHQEDEWTDGSDTKGNAGSAYIFKRSDAGVWNQTEKLVTYDREANDKFGTSIALDEGFLIVGAQGESFNTESDAGAAYIFEALITWKGNSGTDWATEANWEGNILPTAQYNVNIPAVTNQPTISDEQSVNNIEIEENATLTITSGGSLAVMGSASGSGETIVQRNVLGGDGSKNSGGYNIIGSPVSDATVGSLDAPNRVYAFDGSYQNLKSSSSTALNPGQGYFVAYDESDPVMEIEGTLNSGDVSIAVTFNDDEDDENDYNIIANPYAAAISHSEWVATNGSGGSGVVDGAVYFWDDGGSNLGDGTRDGVYQTFDADGDASTGTTASFDGYIRSTQGFYVRALSASDVQFTPSMQLTDVASSNDDDGFYRKSSNQLLRLALAKDDLLDEALIKFRVGSTVGRELGYDVNKLLNPSISFYTLMENQELAIQSLPTFTGETIEIDLGLSVIETGTYNLSLSSLEGFNESMSITIVDNLLNQTYDLDLETSIELEVNELASTNRFTLVLSAKAVLGSMNLRDGLSIYGSQTGLTVDFPGASSQETVIIHMLDGKVVYNQTAAFANGRASIQSNLHADQVYVLRVGGKSVKFILK